MEDEPSEQALARPGHASSELGLRSSSVARSGIGQARLTLGRRRGLRTCNARGLQFALRINVCGPRCGPRIDARGLGGAGA